ncbi:hypothetical protein CPC08DRAFT_635245 [Agrocybe pediades]|nr:hypothetical protein CPC08DRAFT_635245 [Agrocybe pediades]
MAPTIFSGSLQAKKKSDLQEIALALRLSDQGTKDEIQGRIKKHLDKHQDALEDDPIFAGLFGRRKRSLQPHGRFAPPAGASEKPRSSIGRQPLVLDPIKESTPPKDLRAVSSFLKQPISPHESSPSDSPRQLHTAAPSTLPALPASPVKALMEHLPSPSKVKEVVKVKQQEALDNGQELLASVRLFLSNSRNIWSLSAICELVYIISTIVPWKSVQIPLSPKADSGLSMTVTYPPLVVFQTSAFWLVLLHWAIPTVLLPALAGCLISFNPNNTATANNIPPTAPFDPLSSSILRLALQYVYPYDTIASSANVVGLDVLGSKWRVVSASVGLGFAFAEAVLGAPHQAIEKTLINQESHRLAAYNLARNERENTPMRRALMAEEEQDEDEVE